MRKHDAIERSCALQASCRMSLFQARSAVTRSVTRVEMRFMCYESQMIVFVRPCYFGPNVDTSSGQLGLHSCHHVYRE